MEGVGYGASFMACEEVMVYYDPVLFYRWTHPPIKPLLSKALQQRRVPTVMSVV